MRQSIILNRVVVPDVVETRECSELSNFTPINTLEDLNNIRNRRDGSYCLLRDLDFGNNASYEDAATNRPLWWTRPMDFDDQTDFGWQSIGNDRNRFSGIFDGNGFVISNLQINRNAGNQSLFGSITGTVRNLGLTDVRIDAGSGNYSGALASANRGVIIGSYATGRIDGGNNIGGLVGAHLASGWIINSYAGVDVNGNEAVGGLVGVAEENTPNLIINSYATGNISAVGFAGGFVGVQRRGEIRNSYATGNVMGTTDGTRAIGGFVGEKLNNTVIRNSYASGSVSGRNQVGGFIGNLVQPNNANVLIADSYSIGSVSASGSNIGGFLGNSNTDGRVQNSYWDTQTSGLSNSARGSGLNTQQMQSPTAPSPTRYTGWSTDNWDFGTNRQYPRLRYARNPDSSGRRTCSDAGGDGLPVCGSLIAPKPSYDLNELSVFPGRFSPRLNFDGRLSDYRTHVVGVGADNIIRLIVGSEDAGARFLVLRGEDNTALVSEFGGGELSGEITLQDGENHIVVELTPSDPSARKRRYNFRLSYRVPRTPIEINTLEDLDALRNNPTGTYRLTGNLDFEDALSYRTRRVNSDWTVNDFGAAGDDGWQPIDNFTGTFDGNGFAISNLQVKVGDAGTSAVGLFGTIGVRGTVKNLILNDADVRASNSAAVQVAALVGHNRGLVLNSGVIASIVEGVGNTRGGGNHNYIGGLVGRNGLGSNDIAYIGNSFVVDSEIRVNPAVANATHHIGGLVGRNFYAEIYNSFVQATTVAGYCHVGGLVGNQFGPSSTIKNSYADATLASSTESCRIGAEGKLLGLVNGGVIENSYATGSAPAGVDLLGDQISSRASGFPPLIFNDSYWDSGMNAVGDRGRTTVQLQMPTAAVGLYENWSDEIWDFGSESEYPRLKYSAGPFGNVCDVAGAPDCGGLILPQRLYGLSALAVDGANLDPPFVPELLGYFGRAISTTPSNTVSLTPTIRGNGVVSIYSGDDEILLQADVASGSKSEPITLELGANRIVVEVDPRLPDIPILRYTLEFLYLDLTPRAEINYIEDLNNIRGDLSGSYRLIRDLDFLDPASYRIGFVNADWTVADFDDALDEGWEPIGSDGTPFTGTFDGNGNTIFNLQINREEQNQGLFGVIGSGGIVRDLGLTGAQIDGSDDVGALAGTNAGTVIGSAARGVVIFDSGTDVGGLVGEHRGHIINSHTSGEVSAVANVGGLVGNAIGGIVGGGVDGSGAMLNSHANVAVSASGGNVGGLIGYCTSCTARNSFAVGMVSGDNTIGGFVGGMSTSGGFNFVNNYAWGNTNVTGTNTNRASSGGFAGELDASGPEITLNANYSVGQARFTFSGQRSVVVIGAPSFSGAENYWNTDDGSSLSVVLALYTTLKGRSAAQLRAGVAQSNNQNGTYYLWSPDNWDFGNNMQYPILKYAQSTGTGVPLACDGTGLPRCGDVVAPQLRYGLRNLRLASGALNPAFVAPPQGSGSYTGITIETQVRIIPTAQTTPADITLYRITADGRTAIGSAIASGDTSAPIVLSAGVNHIVVAIDTSAYPDTIEYPLYLRTADPEEPDPVIEIDSLEDLNRIRNNPSASYLLTRSLDFLDDDSYENAETNKAAWTVDNFDDAGDLGWQPINNFNGSFDGNGFVIANLQINRNADNIGLFAIIPSGGVVRNLGLLDVEIKNGPRVIGALAGLNRGDIIGCYAVGEVSANREVGGLVGQNLASFDSNTGVTIHGSIINSHAAVNVVGIGRIGGLVGENRGSILNSYATGTVEGQFSIGGLIGVDTSNLFDASIRNSYATGNVKEISSSINSSIGGFAGRLDTPGTNITDSYATGAVATGIAVNVGGFVGFARRGRTSNVYSIGRVSGSGTPIGGLIGGFDTGGIRAGVRNSYWNTQTSGRATSAAGSGLTTEEMQLPTAANATAPERYTGWNLDYWDFGTDRQYPILKYRLNPRSDGPQSCNADGGDGLPICGSLIAPQLRYGLLEDILVVDGELEPPFHVSNHGSYSGRVVSSENPIRLQPIAFDLAAEIKIFEFVAGVKTQIGNTLAAGNRSAPIMLDTDDTQYLIVEINPSADGEPTVEYPLYLQYRSRDAVVEIDSLEDLYNIRNRLDARYLLTRNLDFEDDDSYDDLANKATWTVDDFDDPADTGWQSIGTDTARFGGEFDGNGFVISNLQINRSGAGHSLFGSITGTIRNLGLIDVDIAGEQDTAALVGANRGTVIGSYAVGTVSGTDHVGGLVAAHLRSGWIINSYAAVDVTGTDGVGGLVGIAEGTTPNLIINSYATGDVSAEGLGGGFIGEFNTGEIRNSYATGRVRVMDATFNEHIGGFAGQKSDNAVIRNSYATGAITGGDAFNVGGFAGNASGANTINNSYATGNVFAGGSAIGGLIGAGSGTARDSYWDRQTGGLDTSASGSGQTTTQLQEPTDQNAATGIYANWSSDDWDFGTAEQYPTLKYAQNPDITGVRTCNAAGVGGLPVCGSLIAPQLRFGLLQDLSIVDGELLPRFAVGQSNYSGEVLSLRDNIRLRPVALDSAAEIRIYLYDGTARRQLGDAFSSGDLSAPFRLKQDTIQYVVIEITPSVAGQPTVEYPLHLRYRPGVPIDSLEDLDAVRNRLSGNYVLTRNLDFADDASYDGTVFRAIWTVDDYRDATDLGWTPIGDADTPFTGTFDGNGYTIANLQINNDDNAMHKGLFGVIGSVGTVRNLGLVDAEIEDYNGNRHADDYPGVGTLAGMNDGTVIGSYAHGTVRGSRGLGGLVGRNADNGEILNSHAVCTVQSSASDSISGGLVGEDKNIIGNSYAAGIVRGQNSVGGLVGRSAFTPTTATSYNSYADSFVSGNRNVGGLFGSSYSNYRNLYTTGWVQGRSEVGGLAGTNNRGLYENSYGIGRVDVGGSLIGRLSNSNASLINSYANSDLSLRPLVNNISSGATIRNSALLSTAELQAGSAQSGNVSDVYYNWDNANWDFGNNTQYPVLKYAANTTGRSRACDGDGLPNCGAVIARRALIALGVSERRSRLVPPPDTRYRSYIGVVERDTPSANLVAVATDPNAQITFIYMDDAYNETGRSMPMTAVAGGVVSREITLSESTTTYIAIEVITPASDGRSGGVDRYNLSLRYRFGLFDEDGNPATIIDTLEDLDNIRNNSDGNYVLTRDLDFLDDTSYEDLANKALWTVDDFDDATDLGWQPIGTDSNRFTGRLEGNGYTISNLQINRDNGTLQGLFGATGRGGMVRNLGLIGVKIQGANLVGALVGANQATIIGSYASGRIVAGHRVGGLVGHFSSGLIANSDAAVNVVGRQRVGGLVGNGASDIINSHATGNVSGEQSVGGLVGVYANSEIGNSYASGRVRVIEATINRYIGGLVGEKSNNAVIRNSYATGAIVAGDASDVGGLVGNASGANTISNSYATGRVSAGGSALGGLIGTGSATARNSYWDSRTSGLDSSASGSSQTTTQLQTPTNQNADIGIYENWDPDDWDFGNTEQYPILKYASTATVTVCDGNGLPNCGDLISPQIRNGLRNLELVSGTLIPAFNAGSSNYLGGATTDTIALIPTAMHDDTVINIYLGSVDGTPDQSVVSGMSSMPIVLDRDAVNRIVLEIITGTTRVQYPLYINYLGDRVLADRDGNGFVELYYLEHLDAIRNNLTGNYELMRDLDFNDADSYLSGTVNSDWTVDDFDDDDGDDIGWDSIGDLRNRYTGEFDGNGYTIFNLQINRSTGAGSTFRGLFAATGPGSMVRNLGLIGVKIQGSTTVGALVGDNRGTIIGSYASGDISAEGAVGGLVGIHRGGLIANSHVAVNVLGEQRVGGLAGNGTADIVNSHASGNVSGEWNIGGLVGWHFNSEIRNSYATGRVDVINAGTNQDIGGLVGQKLDNAVIMNSYATGAVVAGDASDVGGLVGNASGANTISNSYATGRVSGSGSALGGLIGTGSATAQDSYWDRQTGGLDISASGSGRTTIQLQAPTNRNAATGIYANWSNTDWDFGSDMQYPILKYASINAVAVCDGTGLPNCGDIISPQIRNALKNLELASGELLPPFTAGGSGYLGTVSTDTVALIPTATQDGAFINIYLGSIDGTLHDSIDSGTIATPIILVEGVNRIVLEIIGSDNESVYYPLDLNYLSDRVAADIDGDGFLEIYYLEHLQAINADETTLADNYKLMRDLDFNDPNSYRSGAINQYWIANTTDTGWVPIGNETAPFSGEFDGNNFVISNLQINRTTTDFVGLFGSIGNGGAVRNLGLSNVRIEGGTHVGAIAGDLRGGGRIVNSYATGIISGNFNVGGLVGNIGFFTTEPNDTRPDPANTGIIVNSRSSVAVEARNYNGGGILGRCNGCTILNSFAVGSVTNNSELEPFSIRGNGGFVGQMGETTGGRFNIDQAINISNNYAWGDLIFRIGRVNPGTFVGAGTLQKAIVNANYASGRAIQNDELIPSPFIASPLTVPARTVPNYYADDITPDIIDDTDQNLPINAFEKTAQQLRSPTEPGTTPTDVYYRWSEDNWDFGTAEQYPTLKYTAATDVLGSPACRSAEDTASPRLPVCGRLIAPKLRYGLSALDTARNIQLSPPFDAAALHIDGIYSGTVRNDTPELVLIATTLKSSAYSIYVNGSVLPGSTRIDSGAPSGVIPLNADGITEVVVEVHGTEPVRYTLNLDYVPATSVDTDHDGLVDINYLEDLATLNFNTPQDTEIGYKAAPDAEPNAFGCPGGICRGYELMRDLDFDDPNSYRSGAINQDWRVSEFDRLGNDPLGWVPIGTDAGPFTGEFEGNSYAISNLQINRITTDFVGLFGAIDNGGAVRNLGVANVNITALRHVGAIAGDLRGGGRIANSYATGLVGGSLNVGGLVGNIGFYTPVFANTRSEPANTGIIVNSRSSVAVRVFSYNGGGILGRCNGCTVLNSFAVGSVTNNNLGSIANVFGTGGFVGQTGELTRGAFSGEQAINISNNYTRGNLIFASGNSQPGTFLGAGNIIGVILNANYALDEQTTAEFANSFARFTRIDSTMPNYWHSGLNSSTILDQTLFSAFERTAQQLREPIKPGTTPTDVYYLWREENWDFGTAEQYPILKYTSATDVLGRPACLSAKDSTSDTTSPRLPVCGTLIAPKVRYGLKSLVAQGATELSPPFDATAQNVGGAYFGTFGSATPELVLIGTTQESSATYSIYVNGTLTADNTDIDSGDASGVIALSRFDVNEIVVEVKGAETVHYTLYLRLENRMLADRDGDGFTEIYYLDHLHAIAASTTTLAGQYELMRDLNFDDPNSYLSGEINPDWRVPSFNFVTVNQGWLPIGNETTPFTGEFDGNGYAIYNLQINSISLNIIGLFGSIDGGAVRNLGVANVTIQANGRVGALAGDLRGGGRIVNSYATGIISGNVNVGGLVGNIGFFTTVPEDTRPDGANAGIIVNSRSSVEVGVRFSNGGGILGRCNGCTILNSFAVGSVTNSALRSTIPTRFGIGGFVGQIGETFGLRSDANQAINISNNYAWGDLFYRSIVAAQPGLFMGSGVLGEAIINANYALGNLFDNNRLDPPEFLALRAHMVNPTSTVPNYNRSANPMFKMNVINLINAFEGTAQQLREPTKPSTTDTAVYYRWRKDNWDFGNDMQYPTLKYTAATDILGSSACLSAADSAADPTSRLPVCGTLIAPKLRWGLESLVPLGDAGMDPPFDADALHIGSAYFGTVRNVAPQIALRATTLESSATYSVYVNDMLTDENTNIASGDPSGTIDLRSDGITEVVVEVNGNGTVRYTLYLEYQPVAPLPAVDADRDGLVEINYLEELAMLRLNLAGGEVGYRLTADDPLRVLGCPNRVCRGYELMRDLDFNDPSSYRSGAINRSWVVHDFAVTTDTGWTPIGGFQPPGINTPRLRFTAEFDGNGYTISNLQINRDGRNYVGLFGNIGSEGVLGNRGAVRNLGLPDVRIEGGTRVGAIAGNLRGGGRIANSYATGRVEGNINVGGLVGNIGFYTTTFADTRPEPANTGIIVNSRSSVAVQVFNYNGGGILGRCNGCTVLNSLCSRFGYEQ